MGLLGKEHAEQCSLQSQDPQALGMESYPILMDQSIATIKRMGERTHTWGTPQMTVCSRVVNENGKFKFPVEVANE